MHNRRRSARTGLAILMISLLAACTDQERGGSTVTGEPPGVTVAMDQAEIHWFEGSVEDAFSSADKSGAPLFLYWGAVWCPPCQEIKHTVFKSQAFINLTRMFVPVYLDGDTDRAQTWGEKFDVQGYPTMIVFNADGEEVTRIPGGIDVSRYNSVLALSLEQMTPTAALVEAALDDATVLSENDFYQLAYYSWWQESAVLPENVESSALFKKLADHAPAGELSSRFYMFYLISLLEEDAEHDAVSVSRLEAILSSDDLTLACWDTLAYYTEDIVTLMGRDGADVEPLLEQWSDQLFSLRTSSSLSKAEQLAGWLPLLYRETREDRNLPETLAGQLRQELAEVDSRTPDSYERQSVINQASYLYRSAGLIADAEALLLAELDKSAYPYYFMSSLAALAEANGDADSAVAWRRKAWEGSTGAATRFQWGVNYVLALVRLQPENNGLILETTGSILGAFEDPADLFAGRNFRGLRRLNDALQGWSADSDVDAGLVSRLQTLCEDQEAGSQASDNCLSLLQADAVDDGVAQTG